MPATQFFAMRRQVFLIEAQERAQDCDIAAIPMCKPTYYEEVRNRYGSVVDELRWNAGPVNAHVREPESDERVKDAMMAAFTRAKGGRYGLR